jgi:glucose-6-phosphate-specific signal transduction histidine kinase
MALTLFHALALIFLYFRYKQKVDLLALAVSTTFIDLETVYYLLVGAPLDHRLLHSFTLALTIYPILVAFGVYVIERLFEGKVVACIW